MKSASRQVRVPTPDVVIGEQVLLCIRLETLTFALG